MIYKVSSCMVFFFAFLTMQAQVYYVQNGASGTGTSWADASGDLKNILSNADSTDQVWVAAGAYYPTVCNPCTETDRAMTFEVPNGVEVYGGFDGTETELCQRDWENNVTTLSGDIDIDGLLDSNAQTIIYFDKVSNKTILDGFTLEDGNAVCPNSSVGERPNSGAAIYNNGVQDENTSHPVIRNCIFKNNKAAGFGAAVYNNGGFEGSTNPVFENCTFLNNTSQQAGGVMYNQGSFSGEASPLFINCTFLNNHAATTGGGAIFNQGAEDGKSNPVFNSCHFELNTTTAYGGAVNNHGRNGKSNPVFTDCTFKNNEAEFGGGVSSNGTNGGQSNAQFENCLLDGNLSSGDGAGIFNWGSEGESNASLLDCTLKSNHSTFAGAGIFNNGIDGVSNITLTNCRFIENTADTYGGAVYNNGKSGHSSAVITNCLFAHNSGSSAGAVYNLGGEHGNANPKITNCTFYGNTANVGGAVYSNASDSTGTSAAIVTNCIFWKNEAQFGSVFRNIMAAPLIQYSVVDRPDCESLNSGMGSAVQCGVGVLFEVYPEFEDTLNGDFRLKAISPLLDLGDNTTIDTMGIDFDLDNQNRIYNDVVDLGAYEYFEPYISPMITGQPFDAEFCEGEDLILSVTASGTGPLVYQWRKNGEDIPNAILPIFMINSTEVNDAGTYGCLVIGAQADTIISETANVIVNPIVIPEVSITASSNSLCEGQHVDIVAWTLNEGLNPGYEWYLNGQLVGQDSIYISFDSLNNGDLIHFQLTSSEQCAYNAEVLSDTIQMEVLAYVDASIEITGPDTVVCLGNDASFEAIVSNEGSQPSFQWFVNGEEIAGQEASSFITSDLENNDQVYCELISSAQCLNQNPVSSNEIIALIDSCNTVSTNAVLAEEHQIILSPNPSNGDFYMQVDGLSGEFIIQVIDLSGKIYSEELLHLSGGSNKVYLQIKDPGLYIIKTYKEGLIDVQKLLIR